MVIADVLAFDLAGALDPVRFAGRAGLTLDRWQHRVLRSCARRVVLRAPRQSGKSTVVAVLALHVATTIADALVLVISPAERQSQEMVRTVRRLASVLAVETTEQSHPMAPAALSASRIEFPNGARVLSLPGSSEATIRGFAAPDLIVVDEASRVSESTLNALRPMMASAPSSRLVLLSTPWQKAGLFYDACVKDSTWERHVVALDDCPRLVRDFIEQERRSLPSWVFSREYEGEFADDDQTLFPAELIANAFDPSVTPLFPGLVAS